MKTRYLFVPLTLLLVLAIVGPAHLAQAQQIGTQSDTIIYPLPNDSINNGHNNLRDFGPLSRGENQCHTIFLKNTSSDPLIIQSTSIYVNGNTADFSSKPIPSLPTILLQNEIISIVDLCFSPMNPIVDQEEGTFTITGQSGSKSVYLSISFLGKENVDPILQRTCDSLSLDADLFGPIIMDGDVTHTATIESNRYDTLQVRMDTGIYGSDHVFSITGITFPYLLAPRERKTFSITFSPRSNVPTVKYRFVNVLSLQVFTPYIDTNGKKYYWSECDFPKLTLAGVAIPPTADSISTALAAGSTDILAMIGDNSETTKTFHFKNTGSTNLKITGVALKNGKSFSITGIVPTSTLPFTLAPGESMSVTVSMTTVTNGVYYDEVIITAEQGIISMDFQLQGLRTNGTAGVSAPHPSQHFTLYPNPSHGTITVEFPGIRNAKIQVIDLLGRVITSATASEKWIWNCTEPMGTYILHMSGTDEVGKTIQSYDRFIIDK
jgi:archaellum component FlaG (FlaF/FlaG flagellin family)